MNRRLFIFNKTVNANSEASGTVSASELKMSANEYIMLVSLHQNGLGSKINNGIFISYEVNDSNDAVNFTIYNSTSTNRSVSLECECITKNQIS